MINQTDSESDSKKATVQAAEVKEKTFDASYFQNPDLMSYLYYGKNVRSEDVVIPGLMVYVASFLEEISGDKLLYVDSACRPLSIYAAELIAPYGKSLGQMGTAMDNILNNANPNADGLSALVTIVGGIVTAGFQSEARDNEGKKDAVILANTYTCKSEVAKKIMTNINAVVNEGVESLKSAVGINNRRNQDSGTYQSQGNSSTSYAAVPSPQNIPTIRTPFDSGTEDRRTWENWFGGLNGAYKEGAEYWASVRSNPSPGSCFDAYGQSYGQFTEGCQEAQNLLTPFDRRRKTDPEYKRGWNNYSGN